MAALSGSDEESSHLFENLTLLLEFHKSTKEFRDLLKEDMFARPNNKAGMKFTLHFLLPIFKPNVFKTTIHWPVYSVKEEATFRSDVLKFISDYNSANKLFELPKILNSILSSAGGPKFVNFLLKVSTAALELTLRKESKDFGPKCDEFKTLDDERKRITCTESCKDQENELIKHKAFISELEKFEEDAKNEIPELENERIFLTNKLTEMTETIECLSATEKKSFRDIENNSCLENLLEKLNMQENAMGVRLEKIAKFKELINKLSKIAQGIVSSKEEKVIFDGSKICPEELTALANQLMEENWLADPVNLFEDGKVNLAELMRVCNAASKRLVIFTQQILNRSDSVPVDEVTKQLETWLEQLRTTDQEASKLEEEMIEELKVIGSAIEVIEEELYDSERIPQESEFRNLVAPSPQVTMPFVDTEEIDEDAVYECAIDSPYIKNFALRLINQLNAAKEGGGTQGVQSPSSINGQSNTRALPYARNASNRVSLLRRNLGTSPLARPNDRNGSLLNQSSSSNNTAQSECGNLSINETFRPRSLRTSTPVFSEAPNDILESRPSTAHQNELPGDSPSVSSAKKADLEEDSESTVWSPRGIFKLNSSNISDEIDATIEKLSEHFAPKTPMSRRLSFLNLVERYKNIKAGSKSNENPVNKDKDLIEN